MSVGGHQYNPDRSLYDDYPTDPLWTHALCDHVTLRGKVWEPAAGSGWMVDVLRERGYDVLSTDLERTGDDFLATEVERWIGSVVTNPPYKLADAFLRKALSVATEQVAFLLPIGALGGKRRSEWLWHRKPPSLILLVPTYMLVGQATSQFLHVWVVWDQTRFRHSSTEFVWAPTPPDYTRTKRLRELREFSESGVNADVLARHRARVRRGN